MAVRDAASLLVGLLVLFHAWGVWADVEVNMEDRVEAYLGEEARINCMFTSAEGVGALRIHWFFVTRSGEKKQIYYLESTMKYADRGTQFTDRVNGTISPGTAVLTISDVHIEDEVEFICHIKSLTEGREGRTKLTVFDAPAFPSIEGIQTGISVNEVNPSKIGTCEVKNGFPKPNITWYRNNTPLRPAQDEVEITLSVTVESSGLFSVRSELRMKVTKEDKDDQFYCEVTYFVPGGTRMTETNRINITVYYPSTAVSVWVESPKGKIKEGDSIMLQCRGNGNTPSSFLSFKHGEEELPSEQDTLVLHNATRLDSGVYLCISTDTDTFEEIAGNTTLFVHYLDPAVVIPEDTIVPQGQDLKATCNALSSVDTHTAWFKDGEEISKGNTLIVKDATFDTAGTYECVVTVPEIEGMETRGTLYVNVQGQPEIIKPDNTEMVQQVETTVSLHCKVRGFPAPRVEWTTADGKVLDETSREVTDEGVQSTVDVKVTSDITVFCNATNDFGTDALTFDIKATTHTTAATTTAETTTTITTTTTSPASTTTISSTTGKTSQSALPTKHQSSGGVIIAVIIICILLLAILGSVLYFLYKKGKICGRSGKQDLTKEKSNKDNIVVEMKSDNTEEAVLLGVNGEKQPPNDQVDR
uniref:Melanoma cell adhesion molecule b n=1 Tax=Sparus aurata TaxID=8175 RepID=A0A671WND5_SPAAU